MSEQQSIPAEVTGVSIELAPTETQTRLMQALVRVIQPLDSEAASRVRAEQEELERSFRPSDASRRQPCTW
jgi:hypothetical protein